MHLFRVGGYPGDKEIKSFWTCSQSFPYIQASDCIFGQFAELLNQHCSKCGEFDQRFQDWSQPVCEEFESSCQPRGHEKEIVGAPQTEAAH